MLVVKLEIWPGGRESGARTVGVANIANVSDLAAVSNYMYKVMEYGNFSDKCLPAKGCCGTIRNHERANSAWELVRKVLNDLFDNRST